MLAFRMSAMKTLESLALLFYYLGCSRYCHRLHAFLNFIPLFCFFQL